MDLNRLAGVGGGLGRDHDGGCSGVRLAYGGQAEGEDLVGLLLLQLLGATPLALLLGTHEEPACEESRWRSPTSAQATPPLPIPALVSSPTCRWRQRRLLGPRTPGRHLAHPRGSPDVGKGKGWSRGGTEALGVSDGSLARHSPSLLRKRHRTSFMDPGITSTETRGTSGTFGAWDIMVERV